MKNTEQTKKNWTKPCGEQADWVPFPWRGQMVTMRQGPTDPDVFARAIEKMVAADLNLLVVEVEKGLRYDSHPKVSADWALSKDAVSKLLAIARRGGMQCVPLLPSLSHSGYLVNAYPQIAETASVCPRHEFTHRVLDDLADELIDLFEPTLFHIGHDEMLSSFVRHERKSALQCPVCRGDDAAEWFRESILRWHDRLTSRGLGMMMWTDMLLDPEGALNASPWQGNMHAFHGGWPDHFERALDGLPRDIIMCDWHYKPSREFQSLRYFQDKGFNVLGCPKTKMGENAFLFTDYAQRTRTPNLLGMLGTNWSEMDAENAERLYLDVEENGAVFGGCDKPELRRKLRVAASRRFIEGPFQYELDFTGAGDGILELAWCNGFSDNHFDIEGLGLGANRRGNLGVPLFGTPDCAFGQLQVEIKIKGDFPGAGRTGVSVDGGRSYTFRPLERVTDWSDVVAGHSRVMWQFDVCNEHQREPGKSARSGYSECIAGVVMSGTLARR